MGVRKKKTRGETLVGCFQAEEEPEREMIDGNLS